MNSEITKVYDNNWLQGWVLFDAACPSCRRFARLQNRSHFGFGRAELRMCWRRAADCDKQRDQQRGGRRPGDHFTSRSGINPIDGTADGGWSIERASRAALDLDVVGAREEVGKVDPVDVVILGIVLGNSIDHHRDATAQLLVSAFNDQRMVAQNRIEAPANVQQRHVILDQPTK